MKKISLLTVGIIMVIPSTATQAALPSAFWPFRHKSASVTEGQEMVSMVEIKRWKAELKSMDKSQLSKGERKELRKEVRSMNHAARKKSHRAVYISVGAFVVVILLVVIFL